MRQKHKTARHDVKKNGPVPETAANKLSNLSTGNCGTPGPTRAG